MSLFLEQRLDFPLYSQFQKLRNSLPENQREHFTDIVVRSFLCGTESGIRSERWREREAPDWMTESA